MTAFNRSDSADTTSSRPACPACRSASVTTTARNPDINSYWRCERCGEVWNIGRRSDRHSRAMPWR